MTVEIDFICTQDFRTDDRNVLLSPKDFPDVDDLEVVFLLRIREIETGHVSEFQIPVLAGVLRNREEHYRKPPFLGRTLTYENFKGHEVEEDIKKVVLTYKDFPIERAAEFISMRFVSDVY